MSPNNNKFKKHKSGAGFTLIELLIYMSIVTLVVVVFSSFMVDVTKSAARAKTAKEVQQNARLILERLTQDIRKATDVDVALPPGQINLTNATGEVSYCLVNNVVHYLEGSVNCSAAAASLSNDQVRVTQLNFTDDSGTYKIDLTVEQRNQNPSASEKSQISLSSTIVPRSSLY